VVDGKLTEKECNFPINPRNKLNLKRRETWKTKVSINGKIPTLDTTKSLVSHGER
jgi:hypothetical protein